MRFFLNESTPSGVFPAGGRMSNRPFPISSTAAFRCAQQARRKDQALLLPLRRRADNSKYIECFSINKFRFLIISKF